MTSDGFHSPRTGQSVPLEKLWSSVKSICYKRTIITSWSHMRGTQSGGLSLSSQIPDWAPPHSQVPQNLHRENKATETKLKITYLFLRTHSLFDSLELWSRLLCNQKVLFSVLTWFSHFSTSLLLSRPIYKPYSKRRWLIKEIMGCSMVSGSIITHSFFCCSKHNWDTGVPSNFSHQMS